MDCQNWNFLGNYYNITCLHKQYINVLYFKVLLGAAEAGLYPGIIYYLSLWFPSQHRVRMMGYFTLASSVGNMLSGPICGWLLSQNGWASLSGWQIIFLATGIFPIILAILVFFFFQSILKSKNFSIQKKKLAY